MGRKNNPPRQRVDNMITDAYGRNRPQSDAYYNNVTGRMPGASQRADQLYGEIFNQATGAAGTSYSPDEFDSYGIFRNMTGPNGGIDEGRIASIDENISGFKDIGRTGGWSQGDIDRTRLQASRVPTSIFRGLKQQADQQKTITGGYAPGSTARMGREAARAAADAVLDSDISTAESIRGGKLAGLAGANSAEMGLLDLITGMQRTGASGMSGVEGMALDATQRERAGGASALAQLYGSSPGELDSLLGQELAGRGLDNNIIGQLIGQQGNEDTRRWDRKGRVSNAAGGAVTTAAGGGAGGTGKFMNKPKG
jgi:hypothetical protein